MPRADVALVLSSEHGGNTIPARYRPLFRGATRVLDSHRGWDPGSLQLARVISRVTHAPLVATTTSRLLVECNRSLDHPRLFSEFTKHLDEHERARILTQYYHPHRHAVERTIRDTLRKSQRVVHVGVHTFTPVFNGRRRSTDIGVLYHPRRAFETHVADGLIDALKTRLPRLRVRRNLPYRGWSDGLTTSLRGVLAARRYAGVELEVNQALVSQRGWPDLQRTIAAAIRDAAR
jgi:predicted N-formylglutamate amidohydrolase